MKLIKNKIEKEFKKLKKNLEKQKMRLLKII